MGCIEVGQERDRGCRSDGRSGRIEAVGRPLPPGKQLFQAVELLVKLIDPCSHRDDLNRDWAKETVSEFLLNEVRKGKSDMLTELGISWMNKWRT